MAPSASVIGDVDVGEKSAVWYGAVLRGDINSIKIGDFTSIGILFFPLFFILLSLCEFIIPSRHAQYMFLHFYK